ncbi:MAG: OmpA family protein [Kiritimatiellia bacterium]
MKSTARLSIRFLLLSLLLVTGACRRNKGGEGAIADDMYNENGVGGVNQFDEFDQFDLPDSRMGIENMTAVDSSAYAPVYFAFDSYSVASGENSKIRMVATNLQSNGGQAVILQGHTDERGSREYNIALGERRALAVRELLISMGISSDRIQTLSYGEELPSVSGSDETAFSLNRRVEFQLMQ